MKTTTLRGLGWSLIAAAAGGMWLTFHTRVDWWLLPTGVCMMIGPLCVFTALYKDAYDQGWHAAQRLARRKED